MKEVLKDTVYISGCSHSHHWYLNQDLKNSWTTQLGFSKVYNHSVCGSSNDFITRRAWMFCEKYKPDLAIIQWTNLTRTEVIGPDAPTDQIESAKSKWADEHDSTADIPVNHLLIDATDYKKKWHQPIQSADYYSSTFYGPWNNDSNSKAFVQTYDFSTYFLNLIKNAFLLQSYFKSIGQDYVFVNGTDWFHASDLHGADDWGKWYALDFLDILQDEALSTVKPLANQIDRSKWLRANINEIEIDKGSDNSHPGIETNKNFAKLIKAELDKINAGDRK